MKRSRVGVAAMIGAGVALAGSLCGCTTTTSLAIQNDTRYPIEIGTYLTSSGQGDLLVPAMTTRSMPVYVNHGASSPRDFGTMFYVLPLPPNAPRGSLRWVELSSSGPYIVRVYEQGQEIAYARIEDGREVEPGSGRIEVRDDAVKPTPREWHE